MNELLVTFSSERLQRKGNKAHFDIFQISSADVTHVECPTGTTQHFLE